MGGRSQRAAWLDGLPITCAGNRNQHCCHPNRPSVCATLACMQEVKQQAAAGGRQGAQVSQHAAGLFLRSRHEVGGLGRSGQFRAHW